MPKQRAGSDRFCPQTSLRRTKIQEMTNDINAPVILIGSLREELMISHRLKRRSQRPGKPLGIHLAPAAFSLLSKLTISACAKHHQENGAIYSVTISSANASWMTVSV